MAEPIIQVHELRKEFTVGSENVEALCGVDLVVQRGELLSIVGPSGSGKSTLLGLIGGLDTPSSGTIILDGHDISRMNERQLTHIRSEKIGFVFQFFNLIPTLTALENVALPLADYPDYCTLNLCRLMYSFETRDVVVSKRASAGWAYDAFPGWRPLVEAARKSYDREATPRDMELLKTEVSSFFDFAYGRIQESLGKPSAD